MHLELILCTWTHNFSTLFIEKNSFIQSSAVPLSSLTVFLSLSQPPAGPPEPKSGLLAGVPDLPGAPQDEAGLTRKFET